MKLNNKLKEKRGSALIFGMVIISLALFFTILVVDFGMGYYSKVQTQTIGDAMTLAGSHIGGKGFIDIQNGNKRVYIKSDIAKKEANKIKAANAKYLLGRTDITNVTYNPTKVIDGKNRSSNDQYYLGSFTTVLNAKYKTMFGGSQVLDGGSPFPAFNIKTESRVQLNVK